MHICRARGARIHSDSWTSSDGAAYNVHSQEVDDFAWLFQDFLPVFAAGNYGTDLYDGTICAPATAKNCLAVGDASLVPVLLPARVLVNESETQLRCMRPAATRRCLINRTQTSSDAQHQP